MRMVFEVAEVSKLLGKNGETEKLAVTLYGRDDGDTLEGSIDLELSNSSDWNFLPGQWYVMELTLQ